MNTLNRTLIAAAMALGLSGAVASASAQTQQTGERAERVAKMGEHRGEWRARVAERRAERAAKLHDALKLNSQQEQAWAQLQSATAPQQRPQIDRAALRDMPAPQRMAQHIAFSKQRIAHMEARQAAVASFYATLSPEQQKTFDQSTRRHGGHHRGHGMRRG